jgi:hypothetical protein
MYLAPLNYDRYFKKVFSDVNIAKRFLEDFFEFTIQHIEILSIQHKVTDDAIAVEFDFRCKIDNHFVIIDMQQWYKPDVIHRFYTYHCINTALQLETLPLKSIPVEDKKERKVKDYNEILPVITLVWMVDDCLGFKTDYVSYSMTPEIVTDFIKNNLLWQSKDITELLKQRELSLIQLNNKTKKLDFLQKNKLIYAFQKNIVKNSSDKNSKYHKYRDWFELAEKTKNRLNEKADFLKYAEDEIFVELMRRISKETLTEEDFTYIDSYEKFVERVKRWEKPIFQEGVDKGIEIGVEKGIGIGVEKGIGIGVEKGIEIGAEKEREKHRLEKIEMIKEMIIDGLPDNKIAKLLKIEISEIQDIRKEFKI